MAQSVKSLPAMWETQVQSQGWEDPLEKEMATPSSILLWKITWTEEPGATVHGVTKSWARLRNEKVSLCPLMIFGLLLGFCYIKNKFEIN